MRGLVPALTHLVRVGVPITHVLQVLLRSSCVFTRGMFFASPRGAGLEERVP